MIDYFFLLFLERYVERVHAKIGKSCKIFFYIM